MNWRAISQPETTTTSKHIDMNRLNPSLYNGISNAIDLDYFLEGLINDNIKALVRQIGTDKADGFKIVGAVATAAGDDQNVTAGYIWLEGEILEVESHTATGPLGVGESWYWQVSESDLSSSQDEDVDGATIYVNKRRKAVLTKGTTPSDYMPKDARYMAEAFRTADDTGWSELTRPSNYTGNVYTRVFNGCLWFKGYWFNEGYASAQVTLPADRRPVGDRNWWNVVGWNSQEGETESTAYIDATNVLDLHGGDGGDWYINFDDIPPIPLDGDI